MSVSSISSLSAPSAPAPASKTTLGKDEFLKLLTTQLQNQDPLSPMDNGAFVAQLAQFSSLEQLQGVNSRLDSVVVASASASQTQAVNFIGKDVRFLSDSLSKEDGKVATFSANLASAAAQVTATVTDENGTVVRTMQMGGMAAGSNSVGWDGLSDSGVALPPGKYHVKLAAADLNGKDVAVSVQMRGLVTGVSFSAGYPELLVGNLRVKMADVVELNQQS